MSYPLLQRCHAVVAEPLESRQFLSAVGSSTLILANAATAKDIDRFNNGAVLDLNRIGSQLSVRAAPTGPMASVTFTLDGRTIQTSNATPYTIQGYTKGRYIPWTPPLGSHTLVVTPYGGPNATGERGGVVTVKFTVTRGGTSAPPPTITPTPTPSPVPTETPSPFPTKVTFRAAALSPVERAEAVGAAVGGRLYVLGGFNNQGDEDTGIPLQRRCDFYDPATNTWHRLRDFPEPFTHSEGVVVGTDIWFVGGYVGNHPGPGTTHVWVYHTTSDTWGRGPDLPQARGAGAAALIGRTIYFTGGMDRTRTIDEGTTWALDLDGQSVGWVRRADLPNPRNHVAAASLGGYLYVIGGQHGQEDAQVSQGQVDRYDPATNTWTKMASLPAGRSHITEGTVVHNGRIVVIGGETASGTPQRSVFVYDPATNLWSTLGSLPASRSTTVAGFINGQLVVATGNGPGATRTTWVGVLS